MIKVLLNSIIQGRKSWDIPAYAKPG